MDYNQFLKMHNRDYSYCQFIIVHDVVHKDPVRCAIDTNTTAEDVVIDLCQKLKIKPVARHLFCLRFHNTEEWVSPLVKLCESKVTTFDFRLRFKIPDFSKLRIIDNEAYSFYFQQARSDILNNRISDIDISCDKTKSVLLGMGAADMCRVMLETGVSHESIKNDYASFIPKDMFNGYKYFAKKPMLNSLQTIKLGKHEAWYVRERYLKQLELLAPNYLCEYYKAVIHDGGILKEVNIHINPYNKKFPGIRLYHDGHKKETAEPIHICSIEELCVITVRSDGCMEIARKNGIPISFKFEKVLRMFSLLSLLDGYYRLGVKWTFSLSKDLPTPSLQKLHSIKCHGPVGGEFSYSKMERLRSNKPGCYILRESELEYDQYYLDVCVTDCSKPTTYKIEKRAGSGFIFNGEDRCFSSLEVLLVALRKPDSPVRLVECLPPSEYDVSPLLLCRLETVSYGNVDVDENSTSNPPTAIQVINRKELKLFEGQNKEHRGRISTVYHGSWCRKKKPSGVPIALKVFKSDHHSVEERLELMSGWSAAQSAALVRLYGTSLSPLAMVMELLPLGPLDAYLRRNRPRVKEVDLVEAANYLATALWNLEEAGMVHGHVRCHKLLVAAHTETSFVVRLSDPGLSLSYTDKDIHWLAPEFYQLKDNTVKTTASDVWAFGTTLWEIFTKGHHPHVPEQDKKQFYLSGRRLSKPKGCSPDLYQLMQQCWTLDPHRRKTTQEAMRDINHLLYQVFNSRRLHTYAVAQPKEPEPRARKRSETSVSLIHTGSADTLTSELTMDSGENLIDFSRQWGQSAWLLGSFKERSDSGGGLDSRCQSTGDMSTVFSHFDQSTATTSLDNVSSMQCMFELEADCNVVLQGRIGQGFYGEVYRASLELQDRDCEPRPVAVKRLKANTISTSQADFDREIDIMKRLKHENIVEIVAVISEPEVSLVMEYIAHGSLQCYLKINRDRLLPAHLLKFALDVANGMDYLGKQNIVHRDLAARNILVASDSHVKISDFGLAQVMGTNDYYILKTSRELPIKWYAPESLRCGKFSPRSDVWSYGVTLFEMFSLGEDPQLPSLQDPTDQTGLLEALESGVRLPCPAACPQHIYVSVIHPCWELDSHKRPSFQEAAHAIQQLRSTYLCL